MFISDASSGNRCRSEEGMVRRKLTEMQGPLRCILDWPLLILSNKKRIGLMRMPKSKPISWDQG
jgi:hypothetical protein